MTGPMTELMECGPVPIDRLEIGRWRWHLHEIARRVVVGACTADAEIRARGCYQCFGAWLNLTWWRRDNRSRHLLGQTTALIRVKDCKALEKRDGARLLAGLRGTPAFVVRGKAIGIDDGRSPFALSDVAAKPERLTKGEPALSGEPVLDDGPPQDQHVNSGVSTQRCSVARHGERRLDRRRPPWLHPGNTACLQLGDDLVGDFGIEARPVVADASSCVCLDIAVLRDGRRKPLSRSSTRHGQSEPYSHSYLAWSSWRQLKECSGAASCFIGMKP